MVSMKDIAKVCGVSVATVSKALNNQKDIGEETKAHIRDIARKMGYFPNSSARALKTNRTYNLGVLFADEAASGLTHDFFSAILDSFKRTVESRGYDITFINSNKNSTGMSYLDHCRYRGFDGVMVACVDFRDPYVIELVESNIPLVTIDHVFNNKTSIVSDNINGMKDLLTYVYECGHRRIAYIHGLESSVTNSRLSSFYRTAEQLGLDIPDEYVLEAPYRSTEGTAKMTERLLDMKNCPTCILYPDDFSTFGGINVIRERGLSIPGDISIAGYDGIRIGRHIEPVLTTLRQDTETIGAKAGEKLIELIEKPKSAIVERVVIKGEVYKGASVARLGRG